jgi:hypothetical protein
MARAMKAYGAAHSESFFPEFSTSGSAVARLIFIHAVDRNPRLRSSLVRREIPLGATIKTGHAGPRPQPEVDPKPPAWRIPLA